jgi:hypothetical protein
MTLLRTTVPATGWVVFTACLLAAVVMATSVSHAAPPGGEPFITSFTSLDDGMFQVGESLTYNVSYMVVDIGQVSVKILEKTTQNNRTVYKAMAKIDSYSGLPFVDLHTIYESAISESLFATRFRSRTKIENDYRYFVYDFDYPRSSVFIEQGLLKQKKIEGYDTLHAKGPHQDGLSLFYYARAKVRNRHSENIPSVVSEQIGNTFIDFRNEVKEEEIDAVDYPVDVVYFEGKAEFVGIFGLTGEFEGWFSNDVARVPILAKMKVLIGSIRIELIGWKREGWTPPRAGGN